MRCLLGFILTAVAGWLTIPSTALAQHHHHGGHGYWGSGHHYSPSHHGGGHHGGHLGFGGLHIAPSHSFGGHHHHNYGGYGYGYGASWLAPIVTQPVYSQPSTVVVNAQPAQPQQLPAPKFGAYANVPRVAADLADFANTMCLTMHHRFQNQPGFNATYRVAYGVLQQAQAIRSLSANPANREDITQRLTRIDEDMHRVFADIGEWVNDPNAAPGDDINTLKQDAGQFGSALHYLMVNVGIAHKDQDPALAARQSQPLPPPPPSDDRTVLKPPSPLDVVPPRTGTSPAEPKFGAYANVPKVASDVAMLANRLCLTMHRGFQQRADFDDGYRAAYDVLQQSQTIRDLARDATNRQEVAKRLEKLDEGMHAVFSEVGEWTNDPKLAGNKDVENLKRDFGVLGNAVHYLMTDVGVKHYDDEPGEGDPPAPPPKPKPPKPAES